MAISHDSYEFILVYIGDSGRNSDGGVFANSSMGVINSTSVFLGSHNIEFELFF